MGTGSMRNIYEMGNLSGEFQTNGLGCAMLETTRPVETVINPADIIDNEYYSKDRETFKHITGFQDRHHTTIRYGFLHNVTQEHMYHVAGYLPEVRSNMFDIVDVEVFSSTIPTEDYECVVALLNPDGILREMHDQFGVLPNLQTFPFKPHVTIGYFKTGFWAEKGVFNIQLRQTVVATRWKMSTARILDGSSRL